MLARRALSHLTSHKASQFSKLAAKAGETEGKDGGYFVRKAVSFVLITVTGGIALSALDDLAIYHACSRVLSTDGYSLNERGAQFKGVFLRFAERLDGLALSRSDYIHIHIVKSDDGLSNRAMEKAAKNQAIKDALGEPIVKGPWYNASLAVAHKRHSASCTFPVSGPQGSGIVQLKAVRDEDDAWFSFLSPRNWEVLIMEALLHVPGNEEKQRTFRISVADELPPPPSKECMTCSSLGVTSIESEKSPANV